MENSLSKATDELARVVWASHILSYRNPYTSIVSDERLQRNHSPTEYETNLDDEDFDDSSDIENTSTYTDILTVDDAILREKFLNCVSELLAHTKGGKHVTATALREKEDSVEVDVARNNGFDSHDEVYLSSLSKLLAMQGDGKHNITHRHYSSQALMSRQAISDHKAVGCHSFLRETIAYNASRLDFWIESVAELLRGSLFRPLYPPSVAGQPTGWACLLGCCSEAQPSASNASQRLVLKFLNFDLWKSASSTPAEKEDQRRQIVELAAVAIGSPQETQSELKKIIPSADPLKVIKTWQALARPLTNLRVILHIARLLPSFRSVTFIKLLPPDPVRLQKRRIPTILQAWKKLELPLASNGKLPGSVVQGGSHFRSDCSRAFTVHCEIQLLTRYEAEPSLIPTLLYFGCSKKACFLCDSFLALSPLKPRVRGRHGQCHPSWGVPALNFDTLHLRLRELCEVVKQKIKVLIQPGPRPTTIPVQQSSAVSELKSADVLEIRRQNENREIADKRGQEYRDRTQILYSHPNGPQKWHS